MTEASRPSGPSDNEATLLDRALRRVKGLWTDVTVLVGAGNGPEDLATRMQDCLAGRGGEASARARAAGLAELYLAQDDAGRTAFLRTLAGFDSDEGAIAEAAKALTAATGTAERAAAKTRLRRALEPPRMRLLTQFTSIPNGVKFLVDLRAELLRRNGDPLLAALESDLRALLANWFDVGFLELRPIDWHSPAALLEKLVEYEAVHRIRTWRDLKNRLDSDRRCYAFFHPRMPQEPLIFVEVALVQGIAGNVQALLDQNAPVLDPKKADTAIFYSINNCQRGLDGISFGAFLIKRVVSELGHECPGLKQFSTLSPLPGFRTWLDKALHQQGEALLAEGEAESLRAAVPGADGGAAALAAILARRGTLRDPAAAAKAEPVLTRLCARYVLMEHGRNPRRARDPVAHFHLSNGARLERINVRGDTSDKGFRESLGLMVNYLYDPDKIEANHEAYAGEGKRAAASALRKLAKA
ncbi:malonyl-CoA decarboxylase [Humitalea sp. 24SJ18S-53]|uniref:malonyl-CoA decarboxylase n=1 Tax=Humitalea sp. 24SJ18S-53 TaxID=3422307 RepID=UPI003D67C0F9